VATAFEGPGLIVQPGVHRSIIFGEVFGDRSRISPRVQSIADVLATADIQVTPVPDARVPIWDKFVYLVAFSGFTGASRLAIGHLWQHPHVQEMFYATSREIAAIAKAEGVTISADRFETLKTYMENIPFTTPSSLLIDLEQGTRIEVEALHAGACRHALSLGLQVTIPDTLHARTHGGEERHVHGDAPRRRCLGPPPAAGADGIGRHRPVRSVPLTEPHRVDR